jgi:hypothetical protein
MTISKKSMWIIFTGSEESPVIKRLIFNKQDLSHLKLDKEDWVEEFVKDEKTTAKHNR